MEKINFEAGTKVSPAKVTIDNVDHEVTPAVWEGNTPLSPFVLNKMQDNIEEEINNSGVVVSATEPTGSDRKKVWLQHSNNIVNKSLAVDNRYVWFNNGSEQISSSNNYWSTGKLKIKSNTTYYFDKNINFIVYYDNLGIAIRLETDKTSFTTDTNEYYVQLSFAKSKIAYNSDIMISTIENASYEPYVEPKIYVLNDNNVYEEFIQKNEKILWENSNPTAEFPGQTINLSDDNYKYYEIIYAIVTSGAISSSGKILRDNYGHLNYVGGSGTLLGFQRQVTYKTGNTITFNDAKRINTNETENSRCIPIQIIGYY